MELANKVIALIWGGVVIVVVATALSIKVEECPREIVGYNCRGAGCDHSPEETRKAKDLIKKRKYYG